jgi:hypothetical protein
MRRAGPRLAKTGRALHEQMAAVEPKGQRLHCVEIWGLDPRARRYPLEALALPAEDRLQRSVAFIAGQNAPCDSQNGTRLPGSAESRAVQIEPVALVTGHPT